MRCGYRLHAYAGYHVEARMGNRHGLITGATGTGKTITLQNLAESFSTIGVPVLLTDIKGLNLLLKTLPLTIFFGAPSEWDAPEYCRSSLQ